MSNLALSDFVARWGDSVAKRRVDLYLPFYSITFDVAWYFFSQGCVDGVHIVVKDGEIVAVKVLLKYMNNRPFITSVKLVSKPGARVYMSLNKFIRRFINYNFQGFYVILTPKGLYSSDQIMLLRYFDAKHSGEIILQVNF